MISLAVSDRRRSPFTSVWTQSVQQVCSAIHHPILCLPPTPSYFLPPLLAPTAPRPLIIRPRRCTLPLPSVLLHCPTCFFAGHRSSRPTAPSPSPCATTSPTATAFHGSLARTHNSGLDTTIRQLRRGTGLQWRDLASKPTLISDSRERQARHPHLALSFTPALQ